MAKTLEIRRTAVEDRIRLALEGPLTVIAAETGFGKTTLLERVTGDTSRAWHTLTRADRALPAFTRSLLDAIRARVPGFHLPIPATPSAGGDRPVDTGITEAIASQMAEGLRGLARDLVLVLDDFHELGEAGPGIDLVEALTRQAPPRLHIVISTRTTVPFRVARIRARGLVAVFEGRDLAFTVADVGRMLVEGIGSEAQGLAPLVHRHTGGWPAAVRMGVEVMRSSPSMDWESPDLEALDWRSVFDLLAEEVLDGEPPSLVALLRRLAVLETFDEGICAQLAADADERIVTEAVGRGLYVTRRPSTGDLTLTPVVRSFLLERHRLPADERASVLRVAARRHAENGRQDRALELELAAGDTEDLEARLLDDGLALAETGHAQMVVDAVSLVRSHGSTVGLDLIEGAARMALGDSEGAIAALSRLSGAGSTPAGAAWRLGLLHHLRGDLDEAERVYSTGVDGDPRDAALLAGWAAALKWLRGDVEACRALAVEALALASAASDARALAAAHTVLAMVAAFESDRAANEYHYGRALEWAERAGDVFQTIRIRVNRGSHHLEEGAFAEALEELDLALDLADIGGGAAFRALGLSNRGAALYALGRLEEAIDSFEASRGLFAASGSRMVAYPLSGMADVNRTRGERALAEARYAEAIRTAEGENDLQGLVPALAGMATLLAEDDPVRARSYADRAVAAGPVLGRVAALNSSAWVALAEGDPDRALRLATESGNLAGARNDRAGLADSLEIRARIQSDPGPCLGEASSLWQAVGSPLGVARTGLAFGLAARLAPDMVDPHRRLLTESGARWDLARAEAFAQQTQSTVSVSTLGGLLVTRPGGAVASTAEWQSKKARDLLKILVSRRGRPVPREQLMDLLWPGDPPDRAANRLSVALTTLRRVLDPSGDAGDSLLRTDRSSVAIALDEVAVDVDLFLREADAGLRELRAGRRGPGLDLLRRATARYAGDFLEEDLYEDWAVDLREEARRTFIQAARLLAADAAASGRPETAARYLLLILERDPSDERAHLALVESMISSGAHGEARRLYRRYVERLEELGIEPAPYPAATGR